MHQEHDLERCVLCWCLYMGSFFHPHINFLFDYIPFLDILVHRFTRTRLHSFDKKGLNTFCAKIEHTLQIMKILLLLNPCDRFIHVLN